VAKWTISPGDWCHIDLPSADAERSKRFYGEIFGWQFETYPGTSYTGITTREDGILSGLGSLPEAVGLASAAPGTVPYIRPNDFEATLAAIERAGGTVLIPKTDVMGFGWFAHFRDPDGNVIGLWEDAEHSDSA
jgi:predicted enzyme related to lactoylglutathione lyase